jgi:endonuclease YncB( thermonuclease family)
MAGTRTATARVAWLVLASVESRWKVPESPLRSLPPPRSRTTAAPRLAACVLLALVIGVHRADHSSAAVTTGAGQDLQVIDGDTLQSGGDIVQLYGIDAPELGQLCWRKGQPWQCGVEAAFALQKLVQLSGMAVICESWHDSTQTSGPNGEVIRVCQLGHDEDLGMALLRNGHGMALPGSFPYYGQLERRAKETGLGIWGSEAVPPWEWRDGARVNAGAGKPAEECNVKGMLDGDGERIYLVPTDPHYDDASVDVAKGEQLFCSDEQARHAGWRRPGETGETGDSPVR